MENHDDLPSPTESCLPYGLFQSSATASVESSPPKSASLSSTSECRSKLSLSSGISDDEIMMMSRLSMSQEKGEVFARYQMDCPSYVPQGILAKAMNETDYSNVQAFPMAPPGRHRFFRGGYYQQQPLPRVWGAALGIGMSAPEFRMSNPAIGGRLYGNENYHQNPENFQGYYRREIPSRNLFEFPTQKESPVEEALRTQIHVFPDRKVNFAESVITFVIQVLDPPHDVHLHAQMFQVSVRSPKGNMVPCRVRSSDSYILNSFLGNFKAEEEAGNYGVRIRMLLPMDKMARYKNSPDYVDGAFHGSANIAVSKNYGLDSHRDCLRIQCVPNPNGDTTHHVEQSDPQEASANGSVLPLPDNQSSRTCAYSGIQSKLWGLTCDVRNNNLLYTDREAHQVYCVSPHGQTVFKFGRNNGVPSSKQLSRPSGIAFDEAHNRFIICDKDNHRVCFFSLDGEFLSSFGYRGHKNGSFEYPWDVDVASNGNLVVSDSKNKRIQLFDKLGNYLCKYTVFEVNPFEYRSQFDYPRGVCFDHSGSNIFVTDFNVHNVLRISGDLTKHQKLLPPGTLLRPQGIAMDISGNLLVADSRHDCLRYMNIRGEHLSTIREIVREPVLFPVNVTTMAGGFVAVLNGNGSITIF